MKTETEEERNTHRGHIRAGVVLGNHSLIIIVIVIVVIVVINVSAIVVIIVVINVGVIVIIIVVIVIIVVVINVGVTWRAAKFGSVQTARPAAGPAAPSGPMPTARRLRVISSDGVCMASRSLKCWVIAAPPTPALAGLNHSSRYKFPSNVWTSIGGSSAS